ncbi:MAG: hypothetical protein OCD76_24995 [Reichenbachiella sp.]
MKKEFILICLGIFISNLVLGQGFEYRVLANKGANKVIKGEATPTFIRTGLKLNAKDKIIVGNNAYIGLMHKTGKTLEVKKPGTFTIEELTAQLTNAQSSVADKYAKFVLNKMNNSNTDVNGNYRNNMKATGAVERSNGSSISVMLPNSVSVFNSEAIIRWTSISEDAYYLITVKNMFDEEIFIAESDKPYLYMNFNDENLSGEDLITLSIKVKGNDDLFSPTHGIERLSSASYTKIENELEMLKSVTPNNTSLNKLIHAIFYEENNLLLDAITEYEEILEQNPDVEDFKILYGEFLINNGLSKI